MSEPNTQVIKAEGTTPQSEGNVSAETGKINSHTKLGEKLRKIMQMFGAHYILEALSKRREMPQIPDTA